MEHSFWFWLILAYLYVQVCQYALLLLNKLKIKKDGIYPKDKGAKDVCVHLCSDFCVSKKRVWWRVTARQNAVSVNESLAVAQV